MFDKNHKYKCDRAVEIVSYLYGEISEREKAVCEAHLADCRICADELADFSFARFAVEEWRDAEFAHLPTPAFEIPFETKSSNISVSLNSLSMLDGLRRFFSFPSVWATSAAALAITVGLVLAATNLFQPVLITEKGIGNAAKVSTSPSIEIAEQPQSKYSDKPNIADSSAQTAALKNNAFEKRETTRQNLTTNIQKESHAAVSAKSTKIGKARHAAANTESGVKNFTKSDRKNAPAINRPAPTLSSFDEDVDNTLRLAELFEETEAGSNFF